MVGCNSVSMMNETTPEAAPPRSRSLAMFAITFCGAIFLPSSSKVSMPTFRTICVKSFSTLT